MMNNTEYLKDMLDRAQVFAEMESTCCKVKVGSLITTEDFELIYGANHGIDRNCRKEGCLRIQTYGEASKLHRLPSDCASIHSEIDAISKSAKLGCELNGAVIFVTRYPCEACARAIIQSGIKHVYYGRTEEVSDMTKAMFDKAGVGVTHMGDWAREDNNI